MKNIARPFIAIELCLELDDALNYAKKHNELRGLPFLKKGVIHTNTKTGLTYAINEYGVVWEFPSGITNEGEAMFHLSAFQSAYENGFMDGKDFLKKELNSFLSNLR